MQQIYLSMHLCKYHPARTVCVCVYGACVCVYVSVCASLCVPVYAMHNSLQPSWDLQTNG